MTITIDNILRSKKNEVLYKKQNFIFNLQSVFSNNIFYTCLSKENQQIMEDHPISKFINDLFPGKDPVKKRQWADWFLKNEYENVEQLQKISDDDWKKCSLPLKIQSDIRQRLGCKKNEVIKKVAKSQIYCRFQPAVQHKSNTFEKTIQAVIIGPCGSGKTSLINHVCGSNLPHGSTTSSLTRDFNQLSAQFSYNPPFIVQFSHNPPFIIYDTPGTTSLEEKMQHVISLKEIQNWKPTNVVFVLFKFNCRYDELIVTLTSQAKMLIGFEKSIVFLISHLDVEKNPQQTVKVINLMLYQVSIQNNVVYFSNQNCDEQQLTNLLYSIAASMPKIKMSIDEETVRKNFNKTIEQNQEIFFRKVMLDSQEEMTQIATIYAQFGKTLPDDDDKEAILQDLQVQLKNQLLQILQKFTNHFEQTMVACNFYNSQYKLQKKIIDQMKEFQKKVRSKESYKFIENSATGNQKDIRDLVKQCPNCKLIWFRIEACPSTTCGNRPSCFFDFVRSAFSRFFIKRVGKKLTISKKIQENNFKSNVKHQQAWKSQKQSKSLGCGQAMNFETLPRLPNIEQILKSWYDVDSFEKVLDKIQMEKDLEKAREDFERKARSSFMNFSYR